MSVNTRLYTTRYWHGQRLEAADFLRQENSFQQVRWWHNRAMHDAVGIVDGLVATIEPGPPISAKVTPGLAYDGFGRELVVLEDLLLPLPQPATDGLLLVLVAGRAGSSSHAGPCDCGCGPVASTNARLCWVPATAVACDHLPLGRLAAGAFAQDFRRLFVRPLRRPRLATGETSRTNTPWEPWIVSGLDASGRVVRKTIGIQTRVDTTAAGFTETPHYFARHLWNRPKGKQPDRFSPAFPAVADPTDRGFTYRLLMEGIVRQAVEIAAPRSAIEDLAFARNIVTLGEDHGFLLGDRAVRLDPAAASLARVLKIDDDVITLSAAIGDQGEDEDEEQLLAWAPGDRTALIGNIKSGLMRLQVTGVAGFAPSDIVVRVTKDNHSNASQIDEITGSTIVLNPIIDGLHRTESLGKAQRVATAMSVKGAVVVIDPPGVFSPEDIVVLMSSTPHLAKPSTVASVSTDGSTITLREVIVGLTDNSPLGTVVQKTDVTRVTSKPAVLVVDRPAAFREGDLVGSVNGRAVTSLRNISGQELTIADRLDDLTIHGRVAAVEITDRYTVREVLEEGRQLRIADDSTFLTGDVLVRVEDDRTISLSATVQQVLPGGFVTLALDRSDLAVGEVVALARLPVAVTVDAVGVDGTLFVSPPNAVRAGDLLRTAFAAGGLAIPERVTFASNREVRLRRPLPGVAVGSELTLVAPMQVVAATPGDTDKKWEVPDGSIFRLGDAVGRARRWRSVTPIVAVQRVNARDLLIEPWLDGALPDDVVGFADFARRNPAAPARDNLILRLPLVDAIDGSDRIVMSGINDRTGSPLQLDALVINKIPGTSLVEFSAAGTGFVLRPEDMTAAALYNSRFADLFAAYARKNGLYVAWLGCQHDEMDCPAEDVKKPCCREKE